MPIPVFRYAVAADLISLFSISVSRIALWNFNLGDF